MPSSLSLQALGSQHVVHRTQHYMHMYILGALQVYYCSLLLFKPPL